MSDAVFPKIWTADELMGHDFPPIRWAVPGILAEGLNLICGAPKLGKSWFAFNIAVAVALGGRALGKVQVEQGDVLYLAMEDPARRLDSRLEIVLEGASPPSDLHLATEWPMLHDGGIALLDRWLDAHPDCRLVVVDVFAKVRGRTTEKEDRYTADYAQMSYLKELADRHQIAVLVVHHVRKAAAEDFVDTVSGTNGLAGAADTILVLARSRGTADAKLHVTGRDVEEAEHALKLDAGRWTLLDGPATDYDLGDTRRRILSLVRDAGPKTPKQLAVDLDLDHNLAKQTCRRMADDGQLMGERGVYSMPVTSVTQSPGDTSLRVTHVTQSLSGDEVTRVTPIHGWDDAA